MPDQKQAFAAGSEKPMPANMALQHKTAALALLFAVAAVAAACAGQEQGRVTPTPAATPVPTPAPTLALTQTTSPTEIPPAVQEYWSEVEQLIGRLVPEASSFTFRVSQLSRAEGPMVEIVLLATFPDGSQARLHIVRDPNSAAAPFSTLQGFDVYKAKDTLWAKLDEGPPPLWAGTATNEGLGSYLNFYVSGEPALTNEHFWNAFSYAEQRIAQALGADVSYLWISFDDQWNPQGQQAGGFRVQAGSQERTVYVGVLFSEGNPGLDFTNLATTLGQDFRQHFAVPDVPLEETEVRQWGYPNHVWYAQWEAGQ
jgi:hypothetical protein